MPQLDAILETALYVDDLPRSRRFYEALGLRILRADERMCAFDVGGRSILLLFLRGSTQGTVVMPGGTIPPHDGHGPLHIAFAVTAEDLAAWENVLQDRNIDIEGRAAWSRGGRSVYFRDPDGHLLELATPGLWETY
ncbi:VOC family protein [Microvirga pudoricolor]|uniref:VOC family protein n=1 Tax=Microvirga pudoricolor TaxID=2778729 RepID=UPI001951CDF6|nr:VOC family protein [Microvirga pudoricolor]MBM6593236.1 VOC family protein [Microvirga pudoricolor]